VYLRKNTGMPEINPCLWFDTQAEDAANFYIAIFPNSRIRSVSRYGDAGKEVHGQPAGLVMVAEFELDGKVFTALNGGPQFSFSEATSLMVPCDTQDEIDRYWYALIDTKRGEGQCGWLKDKFGLSWQIVPRNMGELLGDQTTEGGKRAMDAMLRMTKLDIEELNRARMSVAGSR
jgi:predicted 3-demethylubiquinone-9 3-methyltransferase (glyoxalase superfamily)